jgi:ribosomal protein S7
MCLIINTDLQFTTLEAFERAIQRVKKDFGTKRIKGDVAFSTVGGEIERDRTETIRWSNLDEIYRSLKGKEMVLRYGHITVEIQ